MLAPRHVASADCPRRRAILRAARMTALDSTARLAWRTAHVMLRAWFWLRRPLVRSAQVAV